jgi:hypothetical protein
MPDRPAADPDDPKGLIRESFRIEGITDAECRSILVDWALSLDPGRDPRPAMERLLERHAAPEDHPMSRLLRSAGVQADRPVRRGGRAGRFRRGNGPA